LDALTIRIFLNSVLLLGFLVGSLSLFLQKKNGITKAMATFTLFASLHVGMLVFVGFVDITKPENLVYAEWERIIWNIISSGWILSGLYLAWVLVKQDE
jgi:hypothetical protein